MLRAWHQAVQPGLLLQSRVVRLMEPGADNALVLPCVHLGRSFDGGDVLRQEGKYAYAAMWRDWRCCAAALLKWMVYASSGDEAGGRSPTMDVDHCGKAFSGISLDVNE